MRIRRAEAVFSALACVLSISVSTAGQAATEMAMPSHFVLPLPGELDNVPVLNSNSPEVVQTDGILVSTLPKTGTASPDLHLDYAFSGRFDIFAHHIARADNGVLTTLYLGVLLSNPSGTPVAVDLHQAASYDSQPDAPFVELPAQSDNSAGDVYAGPGDRVTDDVLRGKRDAQFPASVIVPPRKTLVLAALPIPVRALQPPLNGRSLLFRLNAHGPVHAATLAMFAKPNADGGERPPNAAEWEDLWKNGSAAGPREKPPTPPGTTTGIVYGRVAGVATGSRWRALLTTPDGEGKEFVINGDRATVSYPVASPEGFTLGTKQVQSAAMVAREPDTAYAAHGNYGVEYDIVLPLHNATQSAQSVSITLQTPLNKDVDPDGLQFSPQPRKAIFFRGTVRINIKDENGCDQERYVHVTQHQGERGQPLLRQLLPAGTSRRIELRFLYPPDSTPPQAVTIISNPS
jgi:Protein of unknown function (DUF3370)